MIGGVGMLIGIPTRSFFNMDSEPRRCFSDKALVRAIVREWRWREEENSILNYLHSHINN